MSSSVSQHIDWVSANIFWPTSVVSQPTHMSDDTGLTLTLHPLWVKDMATILAKELTDSQPKHGRLLIATLQSRCLPQLSIDIPIKCWSIVLTNSNNTCWPALGWLSVYILTEHWLIYKLTDTQSRYWLVVLTDALPTDSLSTHDPQSLYTIFKSHANYLTTSNQACTAVQEVKGSSPRPDQYSGS